MTAFLVALSSLLIAVLVIAMMGGTAIRPVTPARRPCLEGWRQLRPWTATASQSPWNPDNSLFPPARFTVPCGRDLTAEPEFSRT